jgi:hypothetical protein
MSQADLNFEEFEEPNKNLGTEPAEQQAVEPDEEIEKPKEPEKEVSPTQSQTTKEVASIGTIGTDESGALVAKTFEERWRMARVIAASGLVPQGLNTPEKVFTALQFAHELGLKGGYTALGNIYVVNGKPSLWGELPLILARKSGKLASIKEWVFDANGKEICPENHNLKAEIDGAACKTVRKDGDATSELTTWITVDEAKKAKLWDKAIWKNYPRRMLQCRARAQNLKDGFGDALNGSAIAEYEHNVGFNAKGEIYVESDQSTAASKLNSLVGAAKTPEVLPAEGKQSE